MKWKPVRRASSTGEISWRRNLAVLVVVQFLSTAGFSLIFPFLPLYVRELGNTTGGSVELWAGLVFSAQAFTLMLSSPVWGFLADRYGRKPMLVRATLGGAVLLTAMGFVQSAEQLVLLRAAQGLVTGVIAAANALVASTTPRENTGFAMGTLTMSRWVGIAGGPVIGGIIAETLGFRESFWITGALLGTAGIAVVFLVQEDFQPIPKELRTGFWAGYNALLRAPGMFGLYTLSFLRSLGLTILTPILALFILTLNNGVETGVASMTGIVIGLSALSSALSAIYLGRLGDRVGHQRVLVISAILAAVLYLPQAFVTSPWQLALLQIPAGIAVGGLVPSIAALMNTWSPSGNQGATYGLDNSVVASGRTIAPMLAASLAAVVSYRGVVLGASIIYLIMALVAILVVRLAQRRSQATSTLWASG